MEVFSSDSFPDDVNVTCGSLTAKLRVKDLCDGRSRCILHGEAVVTPCDFERRAGIKSRNWKKTIRETTDTFPGVLHKFSWEKVRQIRQ